MNTYKITPIHGGASYNIEADKYETDESSGRHIFKLADGEIVASLINVNVVRQPSPQSNQSSS